MIESGKQFCFRVTLLEDTVLGSRSGTVGHNKCLDYLPGAVLQGVAANRWYRKNGADEKLNEKGWRLFHSGAVCFSDALPEWDGKPGFPVPLSFHQPKNADSPGSYGGGRKDPVPVLNLAAFDPPSEEGGAQLKQIRAKHITETRVLLDKRASLRMKTAIDPLTGRAAESQLFAYHVLNAGQQFLFTISCFGHTVQEQVDELVELIQGRARIGRSRTAEYGEVEIKSVEPAEDWNPSSGPSPGGQLRLWLLSDLALFNAYGAPTLDPQPEYLGLPADWHFQSGKSFLRSRRYSPFNAKRQCRDPERPVISRGSVLCYHFNNEKAPTGNRFAGLYREQGLGRIACNPQLLADADQQYQVPERDRLGTGTEKSPTVDSPLFSMLRRRKAAMLGSVHAEKCARNVFGDLLDALDRHRTWAGVRPGKPIQNAPGRSQWGRLKDAANRLRHDPETLWSETFGGDSERDVGNPIVSPRSDWQLELGPDQNLAGAFRKALETHLGDSDLAEVLGRIAALGLGSEWRAAIEGEGRARTRTEGTA